MRLIDAHPTIACICGTEYSGVMPKLLFHFTLAFNIPGPWAISFARQAHSESELPHIVSSFGQ